MATAKNLSIGQAAEGSKAEFSPMAFAAPVTTYQGITAAGNVPVVAILAGAGTVGSVTAQNGYDQAGNFVLTAGTATITGGSLASVTFGQPLTAPPSSVIVTAGYTSGTVSLAVGAVSVTKTGFVIQGGAPASAAAYLISYQVIR